MSVAGIGSCILKYEDGHFTLFLVGWRGSSSLRAYVDSNETVHVLRLLGADISKFGKSRITHQSSLIIGSVNINNIYVFILQKSTSMKRLKKRRRRQRMLLNQKLCQSKCKMMWLWLRIAMRRRRWSLNNSTS